MILLLLTLITDIMSKYSDHISLIFLMYNELHLARKKYVLEWN